MIYDIVIKIVDNDSGEILYNTVIPDFVPSSKSLGYYFHRWLDCFVRGLVKGNCISIEFNANLKSF